MSFYIDEDLTPLLLEERRKEWEKVITARKVGNDAWLYRGKAQFRDNPNHNK